MCKGKIPSEFLKEYSKARNIGALLNLIVPLLALLSLILLLPVTMEDISLDPDIPVFAFTLMTFSIAICFMARSVLERLISHVRRIRALEGNYKNKLLLAYSSLYLLYLCPTVWGVIFYVLSGSLIGLIVFSSVTIMAYLFFTPPLENYYKK